MIHRLALYSLRRPTLARILQNRVSIYFAWRLQWSLWATRGTSWRYCYKRWSSRRQPLLSVVKSPTRLCLIVRHASRCKCVSPLPCLVSDVTSFLMARYLEEILTSYFKAYPLFRVTSLLIFTLNNSPLNLGWIPGPYIKPPITRRSWPWEPRWKTDWLSVGRRGALFSGTVFRLPITCDEHERNRNRANSSDQHWPGEYDESLQRLTTRAAVGCKIFLAEK